MDSTKWKKLMDYHHLQQMLAQGVSKAEIARKLGMSRKTLYKWLSRPESGFVDWVEDSVHRRRKLSVYEDFLLTRLAQCPEARPALLLDWLKEAHPDLPALNRKTFYNYIDYLRRHHHLPVPAVNSRQYLCVETLEYGYQAQVDFGECTLSKAGGGGQKVHFFVMSLSRSGYLYVHFQTNPFDAYAVVQCHEAAFGFFGGIPQQLVYDQDRRMIRQENLGEILYTQVFHQYLLSRSFAIYLCRKDDPESKGKVERLVGYVKGNFLAHRLFEGLDALRDQCRAWLARTANVRQHGSTQKQVNEEFEIEKAHLTPYHPLALELPEP
ncbi:MAG: IS21 family transposase [Bacteroidia bacterium]|nr:IS21 family transposase [Bacteroidia bacterium]